MNHRFRTSIRLLTIVFAVVLPMTAGRNGRQKLRMASPTCKGIGRTPRIRHCSARMALRKSFITQRKWSKLKSRPQDVKRRKPSPEL